MSAKIISQRKFVKLVSATGPLAQPPGSLSRMSNLLFTTRGSLQIADGSSYLSQYALAVNPAFPLVEWLTAYTNFNYADSPYIVAVSQAVSPTFANVTNLTATPSGSTTNPAGKYAFGIVAIGSAGGADHTSMSAFGGIDIINPASSFGSVAFTWTPVAGVYGYQIYTFPAGSGFILPRPSAASLLATVIGASSSSYTFTGSVVPTPGASFLNVNTTYYHTVSIFYASSSGGTLQLYEVTAALFAGLLRQPASLSPADPAYSPVFDPVPGYSPYGGISGLVNPIPLAVQFAGQEILILGNGYAPQAFLPSDLASATPTALANTFQAAYPNWQPAVDWITGSQVTDGAGNFYTATQGGVSQTPGPPMWNTTLGSETADGSVIWTSNGPLVASTPPRGAAHAVTYAGSLWLANTSPADTSDGIDGPSCLKMSDSNNPNSWNPVNTAFIGRNEGTQITGLQPFTIAALGISPTGSLCVFKEFTTYQVIGVFGSSSFEIQPAQTNLGCLAARSIQFLPGFGVVRFSHLGFAVFDGINDRLISEDIRPYLFGGVNSEADLVPIDISYLYLAQSAQTVSPPMYMCAMPLLGSAGLMTRLFCYDLVMKAWAILDLPWALSALNTTSGGEGAPIVLCGKTTGQVERMQTGDTNWDTGNGPDVTPVSWSFRTPEVFGEGSSQRLFYEQVVLTGYGNAAMVNSIVANLWLDGINLGSQSIDIVPMGGKSLFQVNIKLFLNGQRAHLDISGNNGGAAGTINGLDWSIVPKSSLARRIIS